MNSENDNYEVIYCFEDHEYRVHCNICDENHLKSQTHINIIHKRNHSK